MVRFSLFIIIILPCKSCNLYTLDVHANIIMFKINILILTQLFFLCIIIGIITYIANCWVLWGSHRLVNHTIFLHNCANCLCIFHCVTYKIQEVSLLKYSLDMNFIYNKTKLISLKNLYRIRKTICLVEQV